MNDETLDLANKYKAVYELNSETFLDLIVDCESEKQFEKICNSFCEDSDYMYTIGG